MIEINRKRRDLVIKRCGIHVIIAFLFWLVVTVSCLIGEMKFRQGKR